MVAHTHTLLLYHIVFSTKHRTPELTPESQDKLFPYMTGIIKNHNGMLMAINGVEDHVHILCRLRPTPDVSKVVKALKGDSSRWFRLETGSRTFGWQQGYGAFTVSYSHRDTVREYIRDQRQHHQKRTFAQEYEGLLVKHGVEYDKRFFLD